MDPPKANQSSPNRLAGENSPYLRAHAANPVDWYPWGAAALERARVEAKPILLSIGYSACHWCHVMAHESFEDPATAAVMNQYFINIKVDRETRPDLDRIYQLAQQMLTGRGGGWPLTMFLLHDDQRPFFGGTYFPKEARYGLPAFADLLRQIAQFYQAHQDQLRGPAAQVVAALNGTNPATSAGAPDTAALTRAPLEACRAQLERNFDSRFGGFGPSPKFPHPPTLGQLLRDWHASAQDASPDLQALYMATFTLTRMAEGGLFDHLGGGFFRYAVDQRWEIPHFEKMLYDNAQLLGVYADAALATGEVLFHDTAAQCAQFLLRELRAPEAGFYSSLDADSEGHEGKYYLWTPDEVRSALAPDAAALVIARYGLSQPPNFEGRWHLQLRPEPSDVAPAAASSDAPASTLAAAPTPAPVLLAQASATLLQRREQRVRPALDDKILTSWNALTITALSSAARALRREDLAAAAGDAAQFLQRTHWQGGRLLTSSFRGQAAGMAFLDDHAFLLEALLELISVRFRAAELSWAIALAELMLQHFHDAAAGGFFFTADDQEVLISRLKSFGDEAIPAGNAVAARALLRLGYLLGEPRYLAAAEGTLRAAWPVMQQYPQGHAAMLQALEEYLQPPAIVLLRGPLLMITDWQHQLQTVYDPRRWILSVPSEATALPQAIAAKPAGDCALAYVCRGPQCSAALATLPELVAHLAAASSAPG